MCVNAIGKLRTYYILAPYAIGDRGYLFSEHSGPCTGKYGGQMKLNRKIGRHLVGRPQHSVVDLHVVEYYMP